VGNRRIENHRLEMDVRSDGKTISQVA